MQSLPAETLDAMRPVLGALERQALVLWNAVYGELRFEAVASAALYLEFDDFEALRGLLAVIREELNRKD